jgi:hypothetical protein
VTGPLPAAPVTASQSPQFREAWQTFVDDAFRKYKAYITSDLTRQVLAHDLETAESILSDVTGPKINQPIGFLKWRLRQLQQEQGERPAAPGAVAKLPAPATAVVPGGSPHRVPAPATASTTAQPADPMLPQFPLRIIDAGGAGNMSPERLHCMGCALPCNFRRRITRAGGADQPQALFRFGRCGCGASTSIVMHEHFQHMYMIDYMVVRPENASMARPSLVPTQQLPGTSPADGHASAQPPMPVPRYAVEELRCPGCAERLGLIVYDPIDHYRHYIEYNCYNCREIYCGTVMGSAHRVLGSLVRSAQPAEDATGSR